MTDYTSEIIELDAAYQANRVARAAVTAEVKSKYRTIIKNEIEQKVRELDKTFADHLAAVKERSGLPVGLIQEHVLHTKSWDRWTYWRDLADIEPEKVIRANAREEARDAEIQNRGWSYSAADAVLTVFRDHHGEITLPWDFDLSKSYLAVVGGDDEVQSFREWLDDRYPGEKEELMSHIRKIAKDLKA